MEWLKEIEYADLLDKDTLLITEHCGMEVLLALWEHMPGLQFYISTKPLTAAKKRYIRKFYDRNHSNSKALALLLEVSERFVFEALKDTEIKDDRQGSLL